MNRYRGASVIAVLAVVGSACGQDAALPVPAEDVGRPCLACRKPVPESGELHVHRGRNVLLCSGPCVEHWHDDTARMFASLQPRGALFNESAKEPESLWSGWLVFGIYVLGGLVFGGTCAYLAIGRGRRSLSWFFAGLVANVPALIFLMTRPALAVADPQGVPPGLRKVPVTRAPASCPSCDAENHPSASACAACGADMTPSVESEVGRS